MKTSLLALLLATAIPAAAQSAHALYRQACGPKDAEFDVRQVQKQPPAAPQPGKALVYFIQDEVGKIFITRIGLDGAWVGVIQSNSYIVVSVAPGEHHLCATSQDRKHPRPELVHFTAEAGKVYYYVVRGITAGIYDGGYAHEFGPMDRDEALYLIASDPQSIAAPRSRPKTTK
ncbi:MAG TPA: DUF2846 domain-containing protein [Candidatus Aquilonibacter sp.]|nr:DUF2846 domain-containing protein [Candidatus Aquilonibacter sp.]